MTHVRLLMQKTDCQNQPPPVRQATFMTTAFSIKCCFLSVLQCMGRGIADSPHSGCSGAEFVLRVADSLPSICLSLLHPSREGVLASEIIFRIKSPHVLAEQGSPQASSNAGHATPADASQQLPRERVVSVDGQQHDQQH